MRPGSSKYSTHIKEIKQLMQFCRPAFTIRIFLVLIPVSPSRYQDQGTTLEEFQNIPLEDPYEMLFKENENFYYRKYELIYTVWFYPT